MNKIQATKIDKHFYPDEESEDSGIYGVFGLESGFCYALYSSFDEANEHADELNNRVKDYGKR